MNLNAKMAHIYFLLMADVLYVLQLRNSILRKLHDGLS